MTQSTQTIAPEIAALQQVQESLLPKDQGFAESLVSQYMRRGSLSEKQWYWVRKLSTLAEEQENQRETRRREKAESLKKLTTHIPEIADFWQLFEKARANQIQRPNITYPLRDDLKIRFSYKSGKIYVRSDEGGDWQDRKLLGVLHDTERFVAHDVANAEHLSLAIDAMKLLANDPSAAGGAVGRRVGACIFCGRELTTTDSLYYGYGPICATKWGLEWGNAESHLIAEEVENLPEEL